MLILRFVFIKISAILFVFLASIDKYPKIRSETVYFIAFSEAKAISVEGSLGWLMLMLRNQRNIIRSIKSSPSASEWQWQTLIAVIHFTARFHHESFASKGAFVNLFHGLKSFSEKLVIATLLNAER